MGLSKVTVNVGQDGIGRRAPNRDKISGILFFSDTLPVGFTTTDNVKKVVSLAQAEALGIAKESANHDVQWYHIKEYFRMQPEGELWIGFYPVPVDAYDFTEIGDMITKAQAEIRLLAVYAPGLEFATGQATGIQGVIDNLPQAYQQFSVLYAPNFATVESITGWNSIDDLRTLQARKVTVVAAQDGGGEGAALFTAKGYSITALGAALGANSLAGVEESIGNPERFNISNGVEMETPALANGDLASELTDTGLGALKDKGYLIARKYYPDLAGTFFERCPTCVSATSDFAWIEYNRVVDKAIRGVRAALTPKLNSKLLLKSDGTMREDTVGIFQDYAQTPLDQMIIDEEVSAAEAIIDPSQNVASSSQLSLSIRIVPVGIAEEIIVNIGLTANI